MTEHNVSRWEFSEQQWDAVTTVDQHVLVSAGAGTGKTRTVVGRILYLLGVELAPPAGVEKADAGRSICSLSDIAAITFTNAAAADLKKKLRQALLSAGRREEAYELDLSRIGTIHSFCLDLLREFALQSGANPRDELVDEATAAAIRAEVVRETILRAVESHEISGLDLVLARYSAWEIRDILGQLLGDSDRLSRIAEENNLPTTERAMLDLALQAAATLDARLVELELIDFDRVIVRTRDMLTKHPQIRATLRRRIKTLIIDEFQDVDPVQKEIAYLLGDPESGRRNTTRLMLVGDAKQSIYGFRRADVTVWRDVDRDFRYRNWGRVFSTNRSYRCTRQILGLVDATIGKALDTPVDEGDLQNYEVPFEPLTIGTPEQEHGAPVELVLIPANDKGKERSKSERRRIEVAAVAKRAFELHEAGYSWSEMAVVLRTWSMASEYRQALEDIGATVFLPRTADFYEQREILDLILALETLCDPLDDRALMGFLRSPFVGLKDETLLALRIGFEGPLWESLCPAAGQDYRQKFDCVPQTELERLALGISTLERYAAIRDRIPTHELLETLLYDTGFLAHLHLLGDSKDQAIANVFRFLKQARGASRMSTVQFLAFVKQARESESDDGEPILPHRDAITITTTHSAKGLEWKVVFWGGLGLDIKKARSGRVLFGRKTLALRDPSAESQPENYEALRQQMAMEGLAEDKRLWYVAATRAIERLVLCGVSEPRIGSDSQSQIADFLLPGLTNVSANDGSSFSYSDVSGESFDGIVRVACPEIASSSKPAPEGSAARSPQTLPPMGEPIVVPAGRPRHSATEFLTFSACPRRHWFKYTLGIREPIVTSGQSDVLVGATSRGLIVHDVLERMREDSELEELLDDAIRKTDEDAPGPGTQRGMEYRDFLRDEITRVADNPKYRAIADLPSAQNELQFLFIANEDEFYEGSIDLAAVEHGELTLLDVKTPQCDEETARRKAAAYRPQQDVYVASAAGIAGMDVGRFAFQFSRANFQVSETLDAQKSDAAKQSVSDTARRIENGECSAARDENECGFCGFASVDWCCEGPHTDLGPPNPFS